MLTARRARLYDSGYPQDALWPGSISSIWPKMAQLVAVSGGVSLGAAPGYCPTGRETYRWFSALVEAEPLPAGRPPRARYLFKHAPDPGRAYASLLRAPGVHPPPTGCPGSETQFPANGNPARAGPALYCGGLPRAGGGLPGVRGQHASDHHNLEAVSQPLGSSCSRRCQRRLSVPSKHWPCTSLSARNC